ncbi:MAG: hypothetical protein Q4B54_02335 [Coriobacteriales bacterium]|nr:hypothetical protein [Coriobacteriales bacterium]
MPSKRKLAANKKRAEARARKSARRRFILFLVEGPSEVLALQDPIAEIVDGIDSSLSVRFQYMDTSTGSAVASKPGGDVTSKFGVTPDTIEHVMDKTFFTPALRTNNLYPRDITHVMHVVDTDGAFVSDDHIEKCSYATEHTIYTNDRILTPDVQSIVERNELKRANIRKLISLSEIKVDSVDVPYSLFFFSSNLDHFLYGEPNLPHMRKKQMARDFSMQCLMSPSYFYDKILGDELCGQCDYRSSWERIQEGTHSLEAHSNLASLLNILT